MQILPLALFLVMLELTVGAFVTLYLLDLRGDTSRGYVVFQGLLYAFFGLLAFAAMHAYAEPALLRGFGLDTAWLSWQGPLIMTFGLLLLLWNVLLWLSPAPARGARRKAARVATATTVVSSAAIAAPHPGAVPLATPEPSESPDVEPPPFYAERAETPAPSRTPARSGRRVVLARHIVGGACALTGLIAVFSVGMAYRPLADARLGGAFVVGTFLAGALALGGVTTAMLLGHWYLNTPSASGKPLEFSTALLLGALLAELIFSLALGPSTAHPLAGSVTISPGTTIGTSGQTIVVTTPTPAPGTHVTVATAPREAPLDTAAMLWLQYVLGLLAPLGLGGVALWLTRGRSFQSATGMLYLCMAFIFIGEIIGRGLLLFPVLL